MPSTITYLSLSSTKDVYAYSIDKYFINIVSHYKFYERDEIDISQIIRGVPRIRRPVSTLLPTQAPILFRSRQGGHGYLGQVSIGAYRLSRWSIVFGNHLVLPVHYKYMEYWSRHRPTSCKYEVLWPLRDIPAARRGLLYREFEVNIWSPINYAHDWEPAPSQISTVAIHRGGPLATTKYYSKIIHWKSGYFYSSKWWESYTATSRKGLVTQGSRGTKMRGIP